MKRGIPIIGLIILLLLSYGTMSNSPATIVGQTTSTTSTTSSTSSTTDYTTSGSSTTTLPPYGMDDLTWSDEINEGDTFEWTFLIYRINGSAIEEKTDEIPVVEGSSLEIEVKLDPHGVLTSNLTESTLNDHFALYIDNELKTDLYIASVITQLIFPNNYVTSSGDYANYFDTSEFRNSFSPSSTVSEADGDLVVTESWEDHYSNNSIETEMRFDYDSGVLKYLYQNANFDQETFEIEVELSQSTSALPFNLFWVVLPLMILPIIYYKKNKN